MMTYKNEVKTEFSVSDHDSNSEIKHHTSSSNHLNHHQNQYIRQDIFHSYIDYVCGCGAAIVNINITFPINKIIFRQMLYGENVWSTAAQLKSEGIRFLYRGIGPPLIQRSISLSLMFGTFGTYHSLLDTYADSLIQVPYARFCLAAFLAGTTEALLCPLERIQMLLQDDRHHHKYTNTMDTFKKLRVYGIKEYYRGLTAILLRNGPSNILFFTFRNDLKNYIPSSSSIPEVLKNFISGSCVGAVISTIFYPLNVVRTQIQTRPPGSRHLSFFQASIIIYNQRDRKLSKLFRGVHVNYSRSFLSWGIVNACYELFYKLLDSAS